jgi:hypothetical protein
VQKKPTLWIETATRELAVLINVSIEAIAANYMVQKKEVIPVLDSLMTGILYSKTDENGTNELISRVLNILAKLSRDT